MSDLDMDAAHCLDLSRVPPNFITMLLQSMSLRDRFTCALLCKAWAGAATAVTHTIILRDRVQDLGCLQCWMENHGHQLVLKLHNCLGAALTALPCPLLQDLLLWGPSIDSRVWSDIAAATKLTSVTLDAVQTASQQADVVSALTALPDLEQLTWSHVGSQAQLTESVLLQKLTKLTAVKLYLVNGAGALEHLGGLTRLQHLSLGVTADWAAAGCPGLQELKALTRLALLAGINAIPDSVSQLTALQQLDVQRATPTALNKLSVLTGLTQLCVSHLEDLSAGSPPLQLPGLQHLEVDDGGHATMPMSFLASCTQLRLLKLSRTNVSPSSLVASIMLQHLELESCRVSAADGAAGPVSWQQVLLGPGSLPQLTALKFQYVKPGLQLTDIERVAACCSSLQVLHLDTLPDNSAPALACLPRLTSLTLRRAGDEQCSSLAQLAGLRELEVTYPWEMSGAGLVQLAALKNLTCLGFTFSFYPDKVDRGLWRQMTDKVVGSWSSIGDTYAITNKAPAGHPSNVPAQLLRAFGVADVDEKLRRLPCC